MGGTKAAGNYSPVSPPCPRLALLGCVAQLCQSFTSASQQNASPLSCKSQGCFRLGTLSQKHMSLPFDISEAWGSTGVLQASQHLLGKVGTRLQSGNPWRLCSMERRCLNALQVLVTQLAAKQSGYADVVYLDAKTDTYLEEVSSCNIFTVKGNKVKTPPLQVKALLQEQ